MALAGGGLFVVGALGLELLEGLAGRWDLNESLMLGLIGTAQEALEMFGVVLFIHAMTLYLAQLAGEVRVHFAVGDEEAQATQGAAATADRRRATHPSGGVPLR
jgi:hypothetical protein